MRSRFFESRQPRRNLSLLAPRHVHRRHRLQRAAHHLMQNRYDSIRAPIDVIERRRFVHVGGLAHLQLHRVHAVARRAEIPRDIAALKAAIRDPRVIARLRGVRYARLHGCVRRASILRTDIQIRQLVVEQTRQHARDGMRLPQQHVGVQAAQAPHFGGGVS